MAASNPIMIQLPTILTFMSLDMNVGELSDTPENKDCRCHLCGDGFALSKPGHHPAVSDEPLCQHYVGLGCLLREIQNHSNSKQLRVSEEPLICSAARCSAPNLKSGSLTRKTLEAIRDWEGPPPSFQVDKAVLFLALRPQIVRPDDRCCCCFNEFDEQARTPVRYATCDEAAHRGDALHIPTCISCCLEWLESSLDDPDRRPVALECSICKAAPRDELGWLSKLISSMPPPSTDTEPLGQDNGGLGDDDGHTGQDDGNEGREDDDRESVLSEYA